MVLDRLLATTAIVATAGLFAGSAPASAEIQELTISVIGAPSSVNAWRYVQKPFYEEILPQAAGGRFTVEAMPHNEAGIDMVEATRMASDGVVNIVNGSWNQIAADDPRFAGMDLPGIGVTVEQARAAAEAYRPIVAPLLEEVMNLKLLAVQPNTMQAILCKGDITGLDYFRGKKVRVWAKAMADYMEELGAITVTIPWEEALPALQRGVADCGITSPANANTAHWWEVLDSLMVIPLGGWAISFHAANLDWWNTLDAETQAFLLDQYKIVEDMQWQQAVTDLAEGVNCNAGRDPCVHGIKATAGKEMAVVEPTAADMELHAKIMYDSVLTEWARVCGAECVRDWNETIGATVGISAPEL